MEQTLSFLIRHGMDTANMDPADEIPAFRSQMQAGLAGKTSSLMMLPSYIHPTADLPVGKPVAVLDAGGTNLRTALVVFEPEGPRVIADQKLPMPGTQGKLHWDAFLTELAEAVAPFARQSGTLGFCFSFPAQITPDADGEILGFNKEVQVDGAAGKHMCRELTDLLNREYGCRIGKYALINDTVATLLGGYAQTDRNRFGSYLGFILGTGMNCCYVEPSHGMIVNMEAGGYDGFPRGGFDLAVDSASVNPGDHQFEKMVSGGYLGMVIGETLKTAAAEGLFSEPCTAVIQTVPPFDMAIVSALLEQKENPLSQACACDLDRSRMRSLVEACVDRAAKMIATMFAAILEQADAGRKKPVCIVAEGSTFWKCRTYREQIVRHLTELATAQRNRIFEFTSADNANLLGAAAAALIKGEDK